jgi:hypothetical protein
MDRNQLIVTYIFHNQENVMKSHTLIDCGATGYAFIDVEYAHYHHLPFQLLKSPGSLTIIDGRPLTLGAITHITHTHLAIWNYQEYIDLFVTRLGHCPIILGIPWLG